MEGFLVGYELPGGVNYRIYHPETKQFKVSRDVIFSEDEFFDTRHVVGSSEEILPRMVEDDAEEEELHAAEVGGAGREFRAFV